MLGVHVGVEGALIAKHLAVVGAAVHELCLGVGVPHVPPHVAPLLNDLAAHQTREAGANVKRFVCQQVAELWRVLGHEHARRQTNLA